MTKEISMNPGEQLKINSTGKYPSELIICILDDGIIQYGGKIK